jgi:hypothetical protein
MAAFGGARRLRDYGKRLLSDVSFPRMASCGEAHAITSARNGSAERIRNDVAILAQRNPTLRVFTRCSLEDGSREFRV